MQKTDFISTCSFKLGDEVKIILSNNPLILSESNYTINDILVIYSMKTENVIACQLPTTKVVGL